MFAPIYNLQMVASAEELWSPRPQSGMAGEHTISNSYGGKGIASEESTPDAVTTQQKPPKN